MSTGSITIIIIVVMSFFTQSSEIRGKKAFSWWVSLILKTQNPEMENNVTHILYLLQTKTQRAHVSYQPPQQDWLKPGLQKASPFPASLTQMCKRNFSSDTDKRQTVGEKWGFGTGTQGQPIVVQESCAFTSQDRRPPHHSLGWSAGQFASHSSPATARRFWSYSRTKGKWGSSSRAVFSPHSSS